MNARPYSKRDDIIVISDEAHRTQAGSLARNMRLALPNAAFIGFTGTPLFKHDQLTRRIFGGYVSRYDFKRSEEDGATVKLVYENRGEKLGVARLDLNDRIAERSSKADLDPDRRRCSKSCSARTTRSSPPTSASTRSPPISSSTARPAGSPASRCSSASTRSPAPACISGSFRAGRPSWQKCGRPLPSKRPKLGGRATGRAGRGSLERPKLESQAHWLEETIIEIIISEAQNEVADFKKWGFDIIPHRALHEAGLRGRRWQARRRRDRVQDPQHPFRVAIVCAMWLTGFDVECLSTLYIDKPMKAHTLMQAIARANRVYPGKDFGLIVDYNGMLKSLREALAQYALGDDDGGDPSDIVAPIEERVAGAARRPSKRLRRICGASASIRHA